MATISTLNAQLVLNTSRYSHGLKKGEQDTRAFSKSVRSSLKVVTGLFAGLSAGLLSRSIIRTFSGFEESMSRVKALSNATDSELMSLTRTAERLGKSTQFSATQAAEAMQFFALAGFKTSDIIASMEPTLALAAAGKLEIAQAADIAAKVMAGMGLHAEELSGVVDTLAKAMTTANTDLLQLGEALGVVGPLGKSVGKDLAELTASIQTLSDAGIQGAEAGTALRNLLIRMTDVGGPASQELERIGVAVADDAGRIKNLSRIIGDLARATSNMTDIQKSSTLSTIGGARAVAALNVLISKGEDELRRMEQALRDSGGIAENIANTQLDNLNGSLTKLKSAAQGLAITFGKMVEGPLRFMIDNLTSLTATMQSFTSTNVETTAKVIAVTTAFSATALIVPKLATALKGMAAALRSVAKGESLVLAFGGPAGWATLALSVTAAAAAFVTIDSAFADATVSAGSAATEIEKVADSVGQLNENLKITKSINMDGNPFAPNKVYDLSGNEITPGSKEMLAHLKEFERRGIPLSPMQNLQKTLIQESLEQAEYDKALSEMRAVLDDAKAKNEVRVDADAKRRSMVATEVAGIVEDLQKQLDLVGLTPNQIVLSNLVDKGALTSEIKRINELQEAIEKRREEVDLIREGVELAERFKLPTEVFTDSVEALRAALDAGKITADQFENAKKSIKQSTFELTPNGAGRRIVAGSAEAQRLAFQAARGVSRLGDDVPKRQLNTQQQMVSILGRIESNQRSGSTEEFDI